MACGHHSGGRLDFVMVSRVGAFTHQYSHGLGNNETTWAGAARPRRLGRLEDRDRVNPATQTTE